MVLIFEISGVLYFGKNNEIRAVMRKPGKWKNFCYENQNKTGNGVST